MNNHSLDPGAYVDQLRHQLLDRVWIGALMLALVGTPASLSRALATGWLPIYTFHLLLGLFVVCAFWFRNRFSYLVRSVVLLALFFLIGAVGVLTFGLLGAGLWLLVVSSFLAGTLLSRKAGWWMSAVSMGALSIAAYLFTSGVIVFPVDANRYVTEPTSWISFLIAVSLLPILVFHAISVFQDSTQTLLQTVNKQRMELERLATHDQLTGLPLPNLAMDRLDVAMHSAQRSGRKVAVMFIDLDDFKGINDTFGHEAGDHVLVALSTRILRALRAEDTAARIGGDEFIAILASVDSMDEAGLVAQRIMEEVSQPIVWSGNSMKLGASIGISLYPDHAQDALSLKRAADAAMYSVKHTGKNGFAFAATAD
jgi:diguanylate cyclase (GGDEF)-like protein